MTKPLARPPASRTTRRPPPRRARRSSSTGSRCPRRPSRRAPPRAGRSRRARRTSPSWWGSDRTTPRIPAPARRIRHRRGRAEGATAERGGAGPTRQDRCNRCRLQVRRPDRQVQRRADRRGHFARDPDRRAGESFAVRRETDNRRLVAVGRVPQRLEDPLRIEVHRDRHRLVIRRHVPCEPRVPVVPRNPNREDAPGASRHETGRLSPIGRPRLDVVVLPDRDVEHFLGVRVEVTREQRDGAVRILVPPFVGGIDGRAELDERARGLRLDRRLLRHQREQGNSNHPSSGQAFRPHAESSRWSLYVRGAALFREGAAP